MPQLEFTLQNLHELDGGRAAAAWNVALKRVISDMIGRKGDDTKRAITLVMELTPKLDNLGNVDVVTADFKIKTSLPAQQTGSVLKMRKREDGQDTLVFASESPDDPDQFDLGDVDDQGEVHARTLKIK